MGQDFSMISSSQEKKQKNKHPDNISRNVNDICLFPSIHDTNEVLGARSRAIYRLTIRDSEGSLGGRTDMRRLNHTEGRKKKTGAVAL